MTQNNKASQNARLQDGGAHITTSDGVAIRYTSDGSGPAVVLLHGLGSCGEDWRPQVEFLAERYRAITVDMRGHGSSEVAAEGYSIERFAADVGEVLDALAIDRAHVVGISMGGGVAFQLAVDHPQRVASLCIVNSGPSTKPPNFKYRLFIWIRKLMARVLTPAQAAPKIAGKLFPEPGQENLRREFIQRLSSNDPTAYRKSLFALIGWDVSDRIHGLDMPTLFISSEHDYTPPEAKQPFVDMMPDARLEIVPDTRHALPMEKPEAFNPVLGKFLAQSSRDG